MLPKVSNIFLLMFLSQCYLWLSDIVFILGAYGEVRKCLNKQSKALRAVKIINKLSLAQYDKEKLLNEIDILKQMDHPNILKLYEFF